ncbi:MAG: site-2 protease family protein [Saprospiraceae bacterium]|nr:site-2 protease family protein [Saprospiraceae bacterium]
MRGSLKVFTWFGIPVYVHWSFGLIFLYILWKANQQSFSTNETLWMTGLYMALFGCVLLHEYGHALTARRYGIRTQDIVLLPIGGMARLERMPEKPIQELVVAIAGPMVNLVIAILLALCIGFLAQPDQLEALRLSIQAEAAGEIAEETGIEITKLLQYGIMLVLGNLVLVIFNMIPAFPMDGGRVFRALLSMRIGRPRATKIAAWVGQGIAGLLAIWGIMEENYSLALLGLFVIYAARNENIQVQTDDMLSKFTARDAVRHQFTRLRGNDWMKDAIELLHHGLERNFLVFDMSEKLLGVLEESEIIIAMRKSDTSTSVQQYTQQVESVAASESLRYVYYLLSQRGHSLVAVTEDDALLGVIDEVGLQYFMARWGR